MENNKLLTLRIGKGLRQRDVADSIGVTTSYYGMIEAGNRKPSIEIAYKLAEFYKTTIEEIFFKK